MVSKTSFQAKFEMSMRSTRKMYRLFYCIPYSENIRFGEIILSLSQLLTKI